MHNEVKENTSRDFRHLKCGTDRFLIQIRYDSDSLPKFTHSVTRHMEQFYLHDCGRMASISRGTIGYSQQPNAQFPRELETNKHRNND